MRLSCRFLTDVGGVNTFRSCGSQTEINEGDETYVYLQLIDETLDLASQGFHPPGRRYVPAVGIQAPGPQTGLQIDPSLQVVLDHVDGARKVTKAATQPFAGDASVWRFKVTALDKLRGTVDFVLTLTENVGGALRTTNGRVPAALLVHQVKVGV